MSKHRNKPAFTLIEFLLSVTLFSAFLVIVVYGIAHIGRSYAKGVAVKEGQQAARVIIKEIADDISNAKNETINIYTPSASNSGRRLCIGNIKYAWNERVAGAVTTEDFEFEAGNKIGFVKAETQGDCDKKVRSFNGTEFLGDNLVVQRLTIEPLVSNTSAPTYSALEGLYKITLIISSDDEAIIDVPGLDVVACDVEGAGVGGAAAQQFCTVVRMTTSASIKR